MPASWPTDLPFFKRADGHSRTGPVGAVERTQVDRGPDKVRRITSASPRQYTGEIPWLDRWQFGRFEAFVTETLADGALSFEAGDPWDGLTKTFRLMGDPPYVARPRGRGMAVSAELEIVARPVRATVSIAASISGDPVQAFAGDTLYAVRAVYAGQPGTLSDEWYRVSTGAVVGTGSSYVVRAADTFDRIGYRTRAVNGPTSVAATQPSIIAAPPTAVLRFDLDPMAFGVEFLTFTAAEDEALTYDGDDLTYDSDPLTFNAA